LNQPSDALIPIHHPPMEKPLFNLIGRESTGMFRHAA
jgi:hypothetical protein